MDFVPENNTRKIKCLGLILKLKILRKIHCTTPTELYRHLIKTWHRLIIEKYQLGAQHS